MGWHALQQGRSPINANVAYVDARDGGTRNLAFRESALAWEIGKYRHGLGRDPLDATWELYLHDVATISGDVLIYLAAVADPPLLFEVTELRQMVETHENVADTDSFCAYSIISTWASMLETH